jgi:tRNA A37 threonylcarbamoyladenosine dehydratase
VLEFSRLELLVGKEGLEKLKNSHVIIFGIGGVGSFVAESLIRAGIGELTFVDYDDICITNLNRQIHATRKTVGKYKVDVMKERALEINPNVKINALKVLYNDETHEEIFSRKYDFVVDAIDMVTSKIKLAEYCYKNNIKSIASMGTGNKFHPEMLEISDIHKTSVCPLAKVMRKELKERRIKKYPVIFSKEIPLKPNKGGHNCKSNCVCPNPSDGINCTSRRTIPGSTSFVPATAGMIISSYVVRNLLNIK